MFLDCLRKSSNGVVLQPQLSPIQHSNGGVRLPQRPGPLPGVSFRAASPRRRPAAPLTSSLRNAAAARTRTRRQQTLQACNRGAEDSSRFSPSKSFGPKRNAWYPFVP